MGKTIPLNFPRRGEVYLVDFDPTRGGEIQKRRPAVVIQNDLGNRYGEITIVAAISSAIPDRNYPFLVLLKAPEGGLAQDSVVLLNQIRSVDKSRLVHRLGKLRPATMRSVDQALQVSLGLIQI